MKQGDVIAYKKTENVVLAWKDKRPVLMCSNYHDSAVQQWTRVGRGGVESTLTKPSIIKDYTANMGPIDRADHYCTSYNFARKSLKWWRKLFFFGCLR